MPLFFVPLLGLMGLAIAMARRAAQEPASGPAVDVAGRMLGWAVGLLTADRAEWGQAMLGELDHIHGRAQRLRFGVGCAAAVLVLPPWGRSVAWVSAMTVLALGSVGLYAGVAAHYQLAQGDWVAVGVLALFAVGVLLGAAALVRRPGVAVPGLLGGLSVALAWLVLSGFTLDQQVTPDIVPWHPWVESVLVPLVLGGAATLWSRDPLIAKRIARLAACFAGLGLYLYADVAVAILGAGGPPEEELTTVQALVSDRLGNNLVMLMFTVMVTATVGWAGAAATATTLKVRGPGATLTIRSAISEPALARHTATALTSAPGAGGAIRPRDRRWPASTLLVVALAAAGLLTAAATWLRR